MLKTRRLAAVWFADLVGYSQLASEDERTALRVIQLFQEAARQQVEQGGGSIVKFLGDGAFAEFTSVEGAVRAALALQREFRNRAALDGLSASLRIGVHIGDVVTSADGDLYGDGVNIAARLQSEAEPGQVLVSEDVWRQLRQRTEYRFQALGERELKGITARVAVFDVATDLLEDDGGALTRSPVDGTPALTEDRLRAELLPDLELCRPLGQGSIARVFLAREAALKRLVAIKVLREEMAADEVLRRRFEREAQAAANVRHPNITSVHRVGHLPRGVPYIVMEFVDGRILEDLLGGGGPLEVAEVRRILTSVAHALAAAHRKGVVHRDVRPSNIIVEEETGRVVLMDFGVAALLESSSAGVSRLTRLGERVGDPAHMSPEQFRGEAVTGQSDVFELGVMGYELLTGTGPFGAEAGGAAMQALEGEEPRDVRELRPEVDPALARLLRRCLALRPEQRPRAIEVAEELTRRESAEAPIAVSPIGGASVSGAASSCRAVLPLLGLAASIAAALAVWAITVWR